ncbi:unnamed protein product [Urochloa decumbens]|uniref:F-box domain-containing protein n=1 Tax=Urochloa decumbens TaxID=240449 RepID=A0ABC9F877_9POAL
MVKLRVVAPKKLPKSEGPARNRLKKTKEFPLHRLPTELLRVIWSQLPFKEAARTSIVSRKWRRLWTCYPKLVLTRETMLGGSAAGDHPMSDVATFVRRVNSIVRQLSSSATLDKFEIKFPLFRTDASHIDRWVSLSAASRARRIVLDLCPEVTTAERNERYSFPLQPFSGSCVKSLCLGFVSMNLPPGPCGFTNLKKLGLHMVSITGDLQCLLPECDVLEWLHRLELQAPNLTKFEFTNYPVTFILGDCPNMSMASIGLLSPEYSFGYACTELPAALPHVQDSLSISLKIRTEERECVNGSISVFANLRHLALTVGIDGCPQSGTGILHLAHMLELAPVLEELEIHMYYHQTPFYNRNLDEIASRRLYKHLRSVHMTGFYAIRGQLELARHILRSSVALERMIIDPKVKVPKGRSSRDYPDLHYADVGRVMARCSLENGEFPRSIITIL